MHAYDDVTNGFCFWFVLGTIEKNLITMKKRTQNTLEVAKHTAKGRGITCQLDIQETYPFWVSGYDHLAWSNPYHREGSAFPKFYQKN